MRSNRHKNIGGQLLFGAVIIAIGVIFMLQNMGIASAHELLQ